MGSWWSWARRPIVGLAVVVAGLAAAQVAIADVGVAWFSPTSASPGSSVVVGLEGCTYPASEVRLALGLDSDAGAPRTHDVAAADAGQPGTYRISVPSLLPGVYALYAACPMEGVFGYWGAEEGLTITAVPDTSSAAAPVSDPASTVGAWQPFALVIGGGLGVAAWFRRMHWRTEPRLCGRAESGRRDASGFRP